MKIYIVTSEFAFPYIEKAINVLEEKYEVKYLSINYIKTKEKKENKLKLKRFSSGFNLEAYLLKRFSNNEDLLLNYDAIHIYSKKFLETIKYRAINFHPAPLPEYRGINTINWGIYKDSSRWAISWHKIIPSIDSGSLYFHQYFDLPPKIYQIDLTNYCLLLAMKSLGHVIKNFKSNKCKNIFTRGNPNSYYYSSDEQPFFNFTDNNDLMLIERCQPITENKKWRWNFKIKNLKCTLISHKPVFKNKIILKKFFVLDKVKIYYAD